MRFVISIPAQASMILGLAAFGIVSAQKMSASRPQATASDSPATPAPHAASTATRRHPVNPVSQIAQTAGEPALAPAAAPDEAGGGDARDGIGRSKCGTHAGGAGDHAGRAER